MNSADRHEMTPTVWIFLLFADHLALIAIGTYEPREIMQAVHTSPEEAVEIALAVRAKRTIGMLSLAFIHLARFYCHFRERLACRSTCSYGW